MTEPITLYIKQGFRRTTRTMEVLRETNDLTIGQAFLTVAGHYEKVDTDYPKWISFSKNRSEFDIVQGEIESCSCDAEKLNLVCDWLGEQPIS